MSRAHQSDPTDPAGADPADPAGAGAGVVRDGAVVALWALPAVYAHGLRAALLAAGRTPVTIHPDPGAPPTWTRGALPTVVTPTAALRAAGAALGAAVLVEVVADERASTFAGAITAGAAGVLDPQATLDHAVEVIAAAAAGLTLIPTEVAQAMTTAPTTAGAPAITDAEHSWLRWLGRGATVITLAAHAAYSEREMYRRLGALYARLGAGTRTQALLNAERWGLLDP